MMTSPAIQSKTLRGPSQPPDASESAGLHRPSKTVKQGFQQTRCAMPQVSAQEFERLPLRVHAFLAGVPLHDVWAIDLPHARAGITLHEFLRATRSRPCSPSTLVRMLVRIRLFVGRIFGWDREPTATAAESFTTRLTATDRLRSLTPASTQEGLFRVVYCFENEQLLELANRTRSCRCTKRPGRNRKRLPLLLRCLRAPCQPVYAGLHGRDRSVSQTRSVPVALA